MQNIYICKKGFFLDKINEKDFYLNFGRRIRKGSRWSLDLMADDVQESATIHLSRVSDRKYDWIEINQERFFDCFDAFSKKINEMEEESEQTTIDRKWIQIHCDSK